MQPRLQPTTQSNVSARLFLRYFLFYFAAALSFLLLFIGRTPTAPQQEIGFLQLVFVLLALLGGFLTVSKPYLLILTGIKAFFDVSLLRSLLQTDGLRFLSFNALLFYLLFSFVLFCLAAARASLFSFQGFARDFSLLFSRKCLVFLAECILIAALSLTLYYIWPQLLALF